MRHTFQQGQFFGTLPVVVVFLVAGLLGAAWSLVLLVDFLNVGGIQTWMLERQGTMPLLWHQVFSDGGITERIRWLFLGGAVWCAFSIWRWTRRERIRKLDHSMLLLTVVAGLVLVSVMLRDSVPSGTRGMGAEAAALLFLTALMIGPLAILFLNHRFPRRVYTLIFAACALYGLAGLAVLLGSLAPWQDTLGQWLFIRFDLAAMPAWSHALDGTALAVHPVTPGHLLVDRLIFSSIELLAAGLLLASFLAIRTELLNTGNGKDLRQDDREAQVLFKVIRRGLDNTQRRRTACSRPTAACGMR